MNSQEQQIQRVLHACADQSIPDSVDLWPRIRAQAIAARQPASKISIFPLRLESAALFLLVILLMGAGCATGAALQKIFFADALVEEGLIHEVDQSQTVDDVTVTIHGAYADARQLMFGIAVGGEMGDGYSIDVEHLMINGMEARGYSITGYLSSFNLFENEPNPNKESRFSYKQGLVGDVSPAVAELTRIKPGDEPGLINVQFELWVGSSRDDVKFEPIGPFHFSFDMPIQPAHWIDVRQTSHDAGVAVTLENVLITPALIQTRVCVDPKGSGEGWDAQITVVGPDELRIQPFGTVERGSGCVANIFSSVQPDPVGTWSVTIDELKSETETINGSWSFQFEVPESNQ